MFSLFISLSKLIITKISINLTSLIDFFFSFLKEGLDYYNIILIILYSIV